MWILHLTDRRRGPISTRMRLRTNRKEPQTNAAGVSLHACCKGASPFSSAQYALWETILLLFHYHIAGSGNCNPLHCRLSNQESPSENSLTPIETWDISAQHRLASMFLVTVCTTFNLQLTMTFGGAMAIRVGSAKIPIVTIVSPDHDRDGAAAYICFDVAKTATTCALCVVMRKRNAQLP